MTSTRAASLPVLFAALIAFTLAALVGHAVSGLLTDLALSAPDTATGGVGPAYVDLLPATPPS